MLPNSIHTLIISMNTNEQTLSIFPLYLHTLILEEYCNHTLLNLPDSLRILKVGYQYNKKLPYIKNLDSLTISMNYPYPKYTYRLAKEIIYLDYEEDY